MPFDFDLARHSANLVTPMNMADGHECLEYMGIDIEAICRKTANRFNNQKEMDEALALALTVTFKRGCNLDKVFVKNKGSEGIEKFKQAINKLGVVRVTNPGVDTLTLGRLSILSPSSHCYWLSQGKEPAHKVYFDSLPRPAHCNSFTSCVPTDSLWDPYFYAGVIYSVYYDTIINRTAKIATTVEQVLNFARSGREGKVMSDDHRLDFMPTIGCSQDLAHDLGWCQQMVEGAIALPCKIAWAQMKIVVERQPKFGPDMSSSEPGEIREEDPTAGLLVHLDVPDRPKKKTKLK